MGLLKAASTPCLNQPLRLRSVGAQLVFLEVTLYQEEVQGVSPPSLYHSGTSAVGKTALHEMSGVSQDVLADINEKIIWKNLPFFKILLAIIQ